MPNIALGWLGEHVELPAGLTAEQLAADLVRVGLEEEAVHGAAVTGPLVVGTVLSLVKEEQKNGKTINWCQVDVGAHNVLDEAGQPTLPRGIVCGAHNFVEGDRVVVALPGAVLPGPFAIASRKTYGHVSDGMICSQRELGLGEDHDGIIVLDRLGYTGQPNGTDAVELLGLGEQVLEINVTPDRGYCFSMRGVAREYSHSTGAAFTDPGLAETPAATADGFVVEVDDDAPIHGQVGCDRFVTRIVRGIDPTAETPAWMKKRLTQAGMRSISLAVDVTNYVMLDLGQPLHAYDLAKVAAPIVVRRAHAGETFTTLDDAKRTLTAEDLLITDSPDGARASRVQGIAGVMGGQVSEVSATTTDVLVEAAHFDTVTVARSSRRHKIPSEAAKRFERGVDPLLPPVAAQRVVDLLVEHGGGTADAAVSDLDATQPPAAVTFAWSETARLTGVEHPRERIAEILEQIGCTLADGDGDTVAVTPPTWRPDLTGPEHLVEEVARIDGYDAIEPVLPTAPGGTGLTHSQRARRSVARALAESGFVETLSYPFVGAAQHDALGLPADDARRRAVRLANPMSDEAPELRTNLLTTLLGTVRRNVGRGFTDLAVSETGLVTLPREGAPAAPQLPGARRPSDDELASIAAAVPDQPRHVAGVLVGARERAGWWGQGRAAGWEDALEAARLVGRTLGVELTAVNDAERMPWHPGRCARLELATGEVVGWAGELHPQVLERLDLPARASAFELDLDAVIGASATGPVQAVPVSTFPPAKEDFAFVVDAAVPADALRKVVADAAGDLAEDVRVFDVFTGAQVGEGRKSVAVALRLRGASATLTAEQTAEVRGRVVDRAAKELGAQLR
ncbi:phenylalanine--tRNA ligase subunit beta [Sanguibacter sp. HDW7]|uniref:phenylalanine--tRNA ligase subunit beta n=1 Tax=Sanguibacter sp. HDW7 TaxID=2714931 RepID=UPI00140777B9|nr:phenylalanine--tRNA ligase subunit beta [Sanguibacter sp. HDW7]QIK83341.1 phenylalanine--tRNA ligase subunit beta [Sanguibacter sp. HDW7]